MHGHVNVKIVNLLYVYVSANLVAILRKTVPYKGYIIKLQESMHKYNILIFQSTSSRIHILTKKSKLRSRKAVHFDTMFSCRRGWYVT